MYRLDRDAVSGSGLGIDIGGARHRATGVLSHHVTTGAAGCLVRKASRARASRRGKDQQGCRCDQGRDAKFHVPSKVRWFVRFAHPDTASVATTPEANATVRHADRRGGGPYRVRTGDLLRATQARYQLRQQPICAGLARWSDRLFDAQEHSQSFCVAACVVEWVVGVPGAPQALPRRVVSPLPVQPGVEVSDAARGVAEKHLSRP